MQGESYKGWGPIKRWEGRYKGKYKVLCPLSFSLLCFFEGRKGGEERRKRRRGRGERKREGEEKGREERKRGRKEEEKERRGKRSDRQKGDHNEGKATDCPDEEGETTGSRECTLKQRR